jgi:hypothetical protein
MNRIAALGALVLLVLTTGAAAAAPERATQPMRVDKSFSIQTSDGCRYNASVRGKVTPAKAGGGASDLVVPNLIVNADLQCRDGASLRVTERVKDTGPMTREDLEKVIEDKGTVTSPVALPGKACVYSPNFNLGGRRLTLASISSACPLPG